MRKSCKYVISGNEDVSPAKLFKKMAEWCELNDIEHDVYGVGGLIESSEKKIADLLGFDAGLFVITGTMSQPTVLQLSCIKRKCFNVAMHSSSHIYLRERQGYQLQKRFNVLPVGEPYSVWGVDDLVLIKDELAAVLYELPMREIGGQLPEFDELKRIKDYCFSRNIHLHMDGARLWEAAAYYSKSYKEICSGFSSVNVSMYKGINGIGGSFLLGDSETINIAAEWMKRQGGNVYHRTPYIVSAMMEFEERLSKMSIFFDLAKSVAKIASSFSSFKVNPEIIQSNIFHIYLPLSKAELEIVRDKLATKHSIWIGNPQQGPLLNQSYIEWYIGDNAVSLGLQEIRRVLEVFDEEVRKVAFSS